MPRWIAIIDESEDKHWAGVKTARLVTILADDGDSCHAREYGDLCGGCTECQLKQARHYGYKILDGLDESELAELEVELDDDATEDASSVSARWGEDYSEWGPFGPFGPPSAPDSEPPSPMDPEVERLWEDLKGVVDPGVKAEMDKLDGVWPPKWSKDKLERASEHAREWSSKPIIGVDFGHGGDKTAVVTARKVKRRIHGKSVDTIIIDEVKTFDAKREEPRDDLVMVATEAMELPLELGAVLDAARAGKLVPASRPDARKLAAIDAMAKRARAATVEALYEGRDKRLVWRLPPKTP